MSKLTRKELVQVIKFAANPDIASQYDFKGNDPQAVALNAIREFVGTEANEYDIKHMTPTMFAIIDEAIDEVVPTKVNALISQFAEVKNFKRNDKIELPR